jgi:hypothetical protein
MTAILRQRSLSEAEESETGHKDRVQADVLATLFDLRKSISTPKELQALADDHNMDVQTLERLLRHFNAPSIKREPGAKEDDPDTLTVRLRLLAATCNSDRADAYRLFGSIHRQYDNARVSESIGE